MTDSEKPKASMRAKADAAFQQAAAKVIELAKRTGTPIIVWERGQIKEIWPDNTTEVST